MAAEWFRADRPIDDQTDGGIDEADSCFSQFCELTEKLSGFITGMIAFKMMIGYSVQMSRINE